MRSLTDSVCVCKKKKASVSERASARERERLIPPTNCLIAVTESQCYCALCTCLRCESFIPKCVYWNFTGMAVTLLDAICGQPHNIHK